jgi:hypothetical protein
MIKEQLTLYGMFFLSLSAALFGLIYASFPSPHCGLFSASAPASLNLTFGSCFSGGVCLEKRGGTLFASSFIASSISFSLAACASSRLLNLGRP